MSARIGRVTSAPLIKHGPLSPEPGHMQAHPWRFTLNQHVYIAGRSPISTFQVIGGSLYRGFPHLHVTDVLGHIYRIPQLAASSKPIPVR